MPKLTQSLLARMKPSKHDLVLWDNAMRGFGFRLKPSGVGSFMLQYRNSGGRSRRYSIGRYGVMTVHEARTEARALLAAIDKGADPASGRTDKRGAPTLADLADRYIKEHAEPHKRPSSVKTDKRLNKANIEPRLGRIKVADLTRADAAKMHHALRETPYEANRTLALLSKMMHLAEAWGLRADGSNPCRHVKRYREHKRERFFSGDELQAIGTALATTQRTGGERTAALLAIRLLALTGCRVGEILTLRWEHVDLGAGLLRLPDAKAGARSVGLPAPAVAMLERVKQDEGFVVEGDKPGQHLSRRLLEITWRRIRDAAKLENARLHDFRHTVGTYGGQAGFNAFMVRDLLGHKTLAMTGRYVEKDSDPLRRAADTVGGRIAAAMDGRAAKVVKLAKHGT